ncbi:hypothetical protein [Paraburkholderia sp. 31.1]|uniref:hypothetical protein n=1 Tax=Paraburkholderia sp. 31.1 TaxID=2615205 RepID=UPI001CA3C122|nr:hypothetical protein [Paraburkholderia sp. 31.1]
MKMIGFFILTLSLISLSVSAAEDAHIFSPANGAKAVITTEEDALTWQVNYGGKTNRERVDVDTEKPIYVDVNDYDFSGHLGFAVWHVDDGMGTYSVYRVFTFSPSTKKFVERSPAPLCGDEFVNLKVDKKGHRLFSTFWDQNIPKVCATRLSPLK